MKTFKKVLSFRIFMGLTLKDIVTIQPGDKCYFTPISEEDNSNFSLTDEDLNNLNEHEFLYSGQEIIVDTIRYFTASSKELCSLNFEDFFKFSFNEAYNLFKDSKNNIIMPHLNGTMNDSDTISKVALSVLGSKQYPTSTMFLDHVHFSTSLVKDYKLKKITDDLDVPFEPFTPDDFIEIMAMSPADDDFLSLFYSTLASYIPDNGSIFDVSLKHLHQLSTSFAQLCDVSKSTIDCGYKPLDTSYDFDAVLDNVKQKQNFFASYALQSEILLQKGAQTKREGLNVILDKKLSPSEIAHFSKKDYYPQTVFNSAPQHTYEFSPEANMYLFKKK